MKDNMLYWTNSFACISRINLSESNAIPEVILRLEESDKPRGIAVDICET